MGWEIWIIPIIAVAVWILSSLFRNPEQNERAGQRNRQSDQDREARRSRSGSGGTDLDKFLQEIQRRRSSSSQQEQRSSPSPQAQPERPTEQRSSPLQTDVPRRAASERRPPTVQRVEVPPKQRSAGAGNQPPRRRDRTQEGGRRGQRETTSSFPNVIPVAEPLSPADRPKVSGALAAKEDEVRRVEAEAKASAKAAAKAASTMQVIPAAVAVSGAIVFPTTDARVRAVPLQQLRNLLSSQQTVRTAFVLQEILAVPLCKRGRDRSL